MKILSGAQMREADRATIENEGIDSIELMERAAETVAQWICMNVQQPGPLVFLVGKGNNGGDGLAVARMLYHAGFDCAVVMPFGNAELSPDSAFNLQRLPGGVPVYSELGGMSDETVIVDAILGTGLDERPLPGLLKEIIEHVNALSNRVIAIDMPSGMRTEFGNFGRLAVQADVTLMLECPRLAAMLPESGEHFGEVVVLPIGLDDAFMGAVATPYYYTTGEEVRAMTLPRPKFGHKGTFGHALLVCGSEGMAGAAVMAAGGALRSGCGLVTVHMPRAERFALHANYPSAMLSGDPAACFSTLPEGIERFTAVGVGCGLGSAPETVMALGKLLKTCIKPMVIDADAINIIAENAELVRDIPALSILTPHPGELRRLIGEWRDDEDKIVKVRKFTAKHRVILVIKGAHTMVCLPSGECRFNSTGTPAMAKGGAGDVLTGLLTGLLSRGYSPDNTAFAGVYLHGLAGEKAAEYYGPEAMMGSEIADFLPEAMKDAE